MSISKLPQASRLISMLLITKWGLNLFLSVQMDLTCFIAMMIFLQSANATFAAFAQGENRITLDYNQFLYATANVV